MIVTVNDAIAKDATLCIYRSVTTYIIIIITFHIQNQTLWHQFKLYALLFRHV